MQFFVPDKNVARPWRSTFDTCEIGQMAARDMPPPLGTVLVAVLLSRILAIFIPFSLFTATAQFRTTLTGRLGSTLYVLQQRPAVHRERPVELVLF